MFLQSFIGDKLVRVIKVCKWFVLKEPQYIGHEWWEIFHAINRNIIIVAPRGARFQKKIDSVRFKAS